MKEVISIWSWREAPETFRAVTGVCDRILAFRNVALARMLDVVKICAEYGSYEEFQSGDISVFAVYDEA